LSLNMTYNLYDLFMLRILNIGLKPAFIRNPTNSLLSKIILTYSMVLKSNPSIIKVTQESILRIFIKPLIIGGEGFRVMYFHFSSSCIISWHSLILFLSSLWNVLVRSLLTVVKLLFEMCQRFYCDIHLTMWL
jgi:hypothetical protein